MQSEFIPVNKKILYAILALAVVTVVGFTAMLSIDLQKVRSIDPADYTQTEVENFYFDAKAWVDGGKIAITGWASVANERIDDVENDIVLYLPSTGEYFRLPTEMQASAEADAAFAAIIAADEALSAQLAEQGKAQDYTYSGFYATVWPSQLTHDLSDYELCMAYRTNYYDAFLHTGMYLEVAE